MNARRWAVLALLASVSFMGTVDFGIVNVALSSIGRAFALPGNELQWVVTAYAIMQAGFVLLGGRLCDVFDRKRVFMVALATFGVASLAGGLAPSPLFVFGARGLQGLAGAVLAPGSLALATDEFEQGRERNRALGVFGAVASLGFLLGSVIGGTLTGFFGWRWVFYVNVPVVLALLVGSHRLVRSKATDRTGPRLDVLGAIVSTSAMLALAAGVSESQGGPLHAGTPIALAAVLLIIFVWIERTAQDALVPFAVFRSPQFTRAILLFGVISLGVLMAPFTVTLFLQRLMGLSPQTTGLIFVPAGVGGILGGMLAPALIRRVGFRSTLAVAIIVLCAGSAAVVGPGMHGSLIWIPVGSGVASLCFIVSNVTCTIAATSAMDSARMGLAAGLLNTSQFLGTAIGAAAAGVIVTAATLSAYTASLLTSIGVLVVALAIALAGFGRGAPEHQPVIQPAGETP